MTLASRIFNRVLDEELTLNDFELKNAAIREMKPSEIRSLLRQLADERRLRVGKHDEAVIIRRIDTMDRALKEALEVQKSKRGERAVKVRGKRAARTGQETCTCGKTHSAGANFYVSARDAGRTALLAGPYPTHAEALARVPEVRTVAVEKDSRAHFYSFGTVAKAASYTKPGLFGK